MRRHVQAVTYGQEMEREATELFPRVSNASMELDNGMVGYASAKITRTSDIAKMAFKV